MEGFDSNIASGDFAAFPTLDPKVSAARKAEEVKRSNEAKKRQRKPTKADVETVKEIAEKKAEVDEGEMRAARLRKIDLYMTHLGHKINYKPKTKPSSRSSIAYLDEVIFNIETDLGVGQGMDMAQAGYLQALKLLEQSTHYFNPLGLQLSGPKFSLGQTAEKSHDAWKDMLTEFAIKYENWFVMSVEKRILFFTFQMIATVDAANKVNIAQGIQMEADEDVVNAAEGL